MNRNPFGWSPARAPQLSGPPRPLRPRELPPDAVPGLPAPRLPSLGGVVPYDPPVIQAPPPAEHAILGAGLNVEHFQTVITVDPVNGSVSSVYKTERPWRGIDVYIQPTTLATSLQPSSLRVLIYGVANGVRALVAQSLTDSARLGTLSGTSVPIYVAAARAVVDSFEVELEAEAGGVTAPATFDVQVTVVASDKALDAPRPNDTGLFRSNAFGFVALNLVVGTGEMARVVGPSGQPMFLSALHAVNTAGAPATRWLQVFDAGIAAVPNGTAPLMSFFMAAANTLGSEIHIDEDGPGGEMFKSQRFIVGPRIIASSTALTLTAVADVGMIGWCR